LLLQPLIALHCNYLIWAEIFRRDGDCCGREKLALLQLPVLVKYRIALVLVPLTSDSRILSTDALPAIKMMAAVEKIEYLGLKFMIDSILLL
jgi:hypothetical protein